MAVTHTFAGLPVADYSAAYDWYVRLLGRSADMFPHDREAVWHLTPASSIYVVEDSERAGRAVVTFALDDLEVLERRLRGDGFALTEEGGGDSSSRVVIEDGDGNKLTFFRDPSHSGD